MKYLQFIPKHHSQSIKKMQLPTHVLAGIFIQYLVMVFIPLPLWLNLCLIITFCVISHFFIDAFAKITYHPTSRQTGRFWLSWHIFVFAFGFLLIVIYFQDYWIGMLAANFVDIWDWYFLRNYARRTSQPEWGRKYYLHPIADKIRSVLFKRLPNYTHSQIAILLELFIYFGWLVLFILTL